MKLFVVVPNWNGEDFLGACIDSLLTQKQACSIVIVENGSVDASDKILASYGNKITVLKQQKNLGFAGGVNVGIKYAISNGADYVALFNNDAIADENWLKELRACIEQNDKCMISTPKTLKADKETVDAIGTSYSIFGAPFPRHRNEIDNGQFKIAEYVFGGAGGASLYKTALFRKIGLFDEDFFAYYEEDDINFRAQLAGYLVITAPKAIVYHAVGGTSGKIKGFTVYQTAKNYWYVYIKNMPGYLFWKYLPLALFWYMLMFVDRTRKGNFTYFMKGFFETVGMAKKTLIKRKVIQKSRKITIKDVDNFLYHGMPPKNLRKYKK
jgi:GT2 family glycosyltransferase